MLYLKEWDLQVPMRGNDIAYGYYATSHPTKTHLKLTSCINPIAEPESFWIKTLLYNGANILKVQYELLWKM